MSFRTSIVLIIIQAFLLAGAPELSAQVPVEISSVKVKVDGIQYYKHTVKAGQTPYGISRAYGVSVEDILKANPGSEKGIGTGQEILVPLKDIPSQAGELVDGYIRHEVKRHETIYGIAREYGISQDELLRVNPGLQDGLQTGQIIRIPVGRAMAPALQFDPGPGDTLVEYEVQRKETLYSLSRQFNVSIDDLLRYNPGMKEGLKSGAVILVPVPLKRTVDEVRTPLDTARSFTPVIAAPCYASRFEQTFRVVLILPLHLGEVFMIDSDDLAPGKIDPSQFRSLDYVQFYEGFMMAMDSLEKLGMNIHVDVFDLPADSVSFNLILRKPALRDADLIIGPEDADGMSRLSLFAARNSIYLINPWFNNRKYIDGFEYTINLVPQVRTQLDAVSTYLLDSIKNPNFIIVHDNLERDLWVSGQLESVLAMHLKAHGYPDSSWTIVNYPKEGLAGVEKALRKNKHNVIITAAMNEAFISSYVSKLSGLRKEFPVTLIGMPWWRNYERIETHYLQDLNLHLFSRYFINYQDPDVIRFVTEFREKYQTEPDPREFLAFRGFDIGMFFVGGMYYFGAEAGPCFNSTPYRPMYTEFQLRNWEGSGFENQFINIYRLRDFSLENVSRLSMTPAPEE